MKLPSLFSLTFARAMCRTVTLAVLCVVCLAARSHGQEPAEKITMSTPPPALQLTTTQVSGPGLIRWFADPRKQLPRVEDAMWTQNGSRLYAMTERAPNRLHILEPDAASKQPQGVTSANVLGALNLISDWAVSPDGRWIFATNHRDSSTKMDLYQADTLQGVWQADTKAHGTLFQAVFTPDSRHLILVNSLPGMIRLSVLEPATGQRVRSWQRRVTENKPDEDVYQVVVGPGYLLLPPHYDDKHRITRWTWEKGDPEPVSLEMEDRLGDRWVLSPDGRWLVAWNSGEYNVMEFGGGQYQDRFGGRSDDASLGVVRISPDNDTLVASGGCRHKVIRLGSRKVIHESTKECRCGVFSADGQTFWSTCRPFECYDTRTWDRIDKEPDAPATEVTQVEFSPDGRFIAALQGRQIDLWHVQGPRPAARFVSRYGADLSSFAFTKDGASILGGDHNEYLRWDLPKTPTPDGSPHRITGTKLFDTFASLKTMQSGEPFFANHQELAYDPATGNCLLSLNYASTHAQVRHPDRPELVRRLTIASDIEFPVRKAFFSKDGKELYYHGDDREAYDILFAYHLETGILRRSEAKAKGTLIAYDSARNHLLVLDGGTRSALTIVDAATLKPVRTLYSPKDRGWGHPAALSADGRWLACMMSNGKETSHRDHVLLLEMDTQKVAALAPVPDAWVEDITFSIDGRQLAFAHINGNVSLWDAARMREQSSPPPDLVLGDQAPASRRPQDGGNNPSAGMAPQQAWEQGPLAGVSYQVKDGDLWQFTDDGAIVQRASQFHVGQILVNGQPLQPKGHRYRMRGEGGSRFAHIQVELRAASPQLRVHRELQIQSSGIASWVDAYDNLGSEPATFEVAVVAALGADAADLRDISDQTPPVRSGWVQTADHVTLLGMTSNHELTTRHAGFGFASSGAEQMPRLKWDSNKKAVVATWQIQLAPLERCHLNLRTTQKRVTDGAILSQFLSKVEIKPMLALNNPYYVRMVNADRNQKISGVRVGGPAGDPEGVQRDQLGFKWRHLARTLDGTSSELGAAQIFPIWLDGAPSSYGTILEIVAAGPGQPPGQEKIVECAAASGDLRSARRLVWSAQEGTVLTTDLLYNAGNAPLQGRAELAVIAATNSQVTGIVDVQGRRLDVTQPIPATAHGNRFAVELAGDSQPAVLVALSDPKGTLKPTLHVVAGRGVFIRYDVSLNPGDRIPLAHLAAPRPIAAFDSAAAAFSAWEPATLTEKMRQATEAPQNGK